MNFAQMLPTFVAECHEQLEVMEAGLLAMDAQHVDAELVNSIFRAAHTIKGSAGLFGLDAIVNFTHVVESVLDLGRNGQLTFDGKLVALLLACGDHIGLLISTVETDSQVDPATMPSGALLSLQLESYLLASRDAPASVVPKPSQAALSDGRESNTLLENANWHISLRFGRDVFRHGMDPLSFIRYLGQLGTVVDIVTIVDDALVADGFEPESCYLAFDITFSSQADKSAIEDVFGFLGDDCAVRILPPTSRTSEYVRIIDALPDEPARLGEILVGCGTVTKSEVDDALDKQRRTGEAQPIGAILVENGSIRPAVVDAALTKQRRIRDAALQGTRSIRVDADKLDHLINLVGELTISAAGTQLIARRAHLAELQECTATLGRLVDEVRD
ncbi:MAG TPA: Hpt domain-containing protein, partial [Polyangiaceae bacterium]